jgi:MFS family permease
MGQTVSQSGTWIELTATTWLLYQLTGSPLLLGLGGLFRALPIFAFAIVGGTVADRVERRRLLLFTQSSSVVTSVLLGALVVTGQVAFWHIYVFNLLNATIAAFDAPGRQAMFPTLVPRGQLQNAITLNAVLFRTSTLVGPAVAGLLISRVGIASPFFVNAVSYFAIIGALLAMRMSPILERTRGPLLGEALGGLRYVRTNAIVPLVLGMEGALSIFGHNQALITIFARDVLGTDAEGLGLLLSSIGAGAIVGMFTLIALGDIRRKGVFMIVAGIVYAAAMLAFAGSRSFALSIAILAVLGFADATWGTMRSTIVQLAADDAYRGRVMSLLIMVGRGLTQASQLQTGLMTTLVGPMSAATFGAIVVGGVVAAVAARAPRLRDFSSAARRVRVAEAAQAGGES